jgi:hypothetical protein
MVWRFGGQPRGLPLRYNYISRLDQTVGAGLACATEPWRSGAPPARGIRVAEGSGGDSI